MTPTTHAGTRAGDALRRRLGGTGTAAAPAFPRRTSGPAAPPRQDPHTRRASRPQPGAAPRRRGATGAFDRVKGLPDAPLLDRLLRGRLWIPVIAVLLGGIVAMQVAMLELNAGIGRTVESSAALERENSVLRSQVAELDGAERVEGAARKLGMVSPAAGSFRYRTARGAEDAREATKVMEAPRAPVVAGSTLPQAPELPDAVTPAPTQAAATQAAAPTQAATPTAAAGTTPAAGTTAGAGTTPAPAATPTTSTPTTSATTAGAAGGLGAP